MAGLLAAAATLGGVEAAVALAREAQACAVRLPAGTLSLRVRLLEPIDSAGGQVRVRPVSAGCEGDVTARWPAAHAADAGAEARVTARWIARPQWSGRGDGTLVVSGVHASGASVLASGAAERLRSWATTAARRLYGPRAELVEALVLGRRVGLEPALRDDFAQSGLIHLLSISGFHVGLVAAWVALACRAAGMRRERALLAAAGTAVLYVSFLGWPAPATRAALLAVLAAWCRQRQRNVRANPLLSATCLAVMLIDPWAVLDLGAWLSAGALWGAATATRWSDRALGTSWGWRALSSSIGATLATAPLTAAALGTVAPIGIALNFAAIPLAAVAVPGVFASLLLLPFAPDAAASLAAGAGLGLHLIELLAAVGAAVPGGHVVTEAGPGAAVPWLLALAAFLWGMHARTTRAEALRRWAWVGAFALWIPLALQLGRPAAYGPSDLTLHFLDVGQGDGAVLRTPRGHYVVVDAGPAGGHGAGGRADAGRRVLVPFLAREGVAEISAMIVSHAHADHVGGAAAVLDRFHTDLVIEPGERYADPVYYHFLDAVAADGVPWRPGRPGDRFTLDGVSFTLLHPNPAWPHWGEDLNEDSVVLLVQYGGFRALLPGDAGLVAEHWLAGRAGRVDFLKVGHHGSRGATGDAWLDELHPKAAVVSVGTHNTYGHPSAEALARLRAHGVAVWRTDQDGQVDVVTDGATMTVQSRTRRQVFSVQDSLDGR
ncbi:MAG TPA: DNA internalization-related competence protein ComEC/Rec2 [Gemmatimonadales bacterium]|nr:DNA internalization-related competence protein ComEC/Rec2 [Gemmatimonadales bacterium]